MSISSLSAALAISLALISSAMADDAARQVGSAKTVYCRDPERELVTETTASDCHGTVIDEAEAQAIRERRRLAIERALTKKARAQNNLRLASLGAAFYVSRSGRLLSNRHVVKGCAQVMIRPPGQAALVASVLDVDPQADLALVQVDAEAPVVAVFRSGGSIPDGAVVSMAGYPDQGLAPLEPVVTPGKLIGALHGAGGEGHMVIAASLRHGNSGGPVLDETGLVIGVVDAKVDTVRTYRTIGRQVADVGVGIGLGLVLDFLARTKTDFQTMSPGEVRSAEGMAALARRIVARAECWK